MTMTPRQVIALAAIGGFAAAVTLLAVAVLGWGVYTAVGRTFTAADRWREHIRNHRQLKAFRRQLDQAPTADEPDHET